MWDLFEDELLDLRLRHPLVDVAGPRVEQQRVPGTKRQPAQRLRKAHHALLVGVRDDEDPVSVGEDLLQHDDLADLFVVEGGDHVESLVEHDLLSASQLVELDGGTDVHAQLAAASEHVDGVILVAGQERAETGRRLREPVDLLLESHDLVASLTESLREPFVLCRDGRQGPLGVGEPLLDRPGVSRGLGEPAPQIRDLLLEEAQLRSQLFR
jgi:hypothetical protein